MLTNGYGNFFAGETAKRWRRETFSLQPFSLLFRALFSDELLNLPPAYAKKIPDLLRYLGRWYLKNKAIDEYSALDPPWVNQLHSSKFIVSIVAFTETFQCPICYATGANAVADCDSHIKHEVCNRHMPMCKISKKLTFSGRVMVTRHCSDKQAQDDLEQKPKCARCPQYGFCAESLCMAHLPGIICFQVALFRDFAPVAVA